MRTLTDHIVTDKCANLTVEVLDEPGQGGASHLYQITGFNTETNGSCPFTERYGKPSDHTTILFQNGPIDENGNGANGIQQEALLAIVLDRLRGFQSGQYRCRENACAITHIEEALMWLQKRTRDRLARGVEGTHTV